MADLVMHLKHYALKSNCTLVLAGDMNTDLYAEHRKGKDVDALVWLLRELNLVGCATAAWPETHHLFCTVVMCLTPIRTLITCSSLSRALVWFGDSASMTTGTFARIVGGGTLFFSWTLT